MDSNGGSKNGGGNKSPRSLNQEELTAVFRKLGARDPESWAGSQIREGINQLARFVFLRKAWSLIVKEDDASWIDVLEVPFGPDGALDCELVGHPGWSVLL